MRRFFAPPESFAGDRAVITGDLFRHMVKVLRLKVGERLLLADGAGGQFAGMIDEVSKENLVVTLLERNVEPPESGPRITLYQGLPKGDKLELILQKTTELGVAEVIPFVAARSVSRIRKGEEAEKVARWQRIAREAARQSGRNSVSSGVDCSDRWAGRWIIRGRSHSGTGTWVHPGFSGGADSQNRNRRLGHNSFTAVSLGRPGIRTAEIAFL